MEKYLLNTQLVVLVLLVLLVSYTIHYIRELKNCVCFKSNDKYNVNLEFLEFYQYLELFSIFLLFLGLFSMNKSFLKMVGMNKKSKVNPFFALLMMVVLMSVHFFIQYNVLKNTYSLSRSIKEDCECASKWQRFFLYFQGVSSGIEVAHMVVAVLTIFILLVSGLFHALFA